ncbi:hypothetical protein BDR06DRAFT_1018757 [Suillus hirtellus]|nr:hypothetical protein BDR06DRAFT_1018757 [Suillus hirtellus]
MPTVDGPLWCPRHNEERLKLYANYKAHHALLDTLVDNPACSDVTTILGCTALPLLKEWNDCLRLKYNLLTRCIEARVYFSERFFGNDMDFGHKAFWESLVKKRAEVERFLYYVETRAYQLILQAQNALWVLDRDSDAHDSGDCSGYEDESLARDASFHSIESARDAAIDDPLEAVLREKSVEFLEKIRSRLARYCCTPSTSRYHDERLEVIYAYVRRGIFTEPALMFLSQSYDSVMALLNDDNLDLVTLEKIWNAVKTLCVHDIRDAVDDVLRVNREGDYVMVLGGKVFKETSGEEWPLHAWGHMMAIYHCYSCLRTACKTMDEVIAMTRFALFSETALSQSCIKYEYGFDGAKELILAGFIPSDIPLSSPRHSIICTDSGSQSFGPMWEETKRNLSLYGSLSLNDAKAQAFVNGCIRHPDLMVMLRKGADGRVIRSRPVVWTSRKRHARSRSALASVPWEKTRDVVRCEDDDLEEAQPSGWNHEKIADCLMVVLVDSGEGNMGDFVRKLLEIWCQVYHVEDKKELYCALETTFVEAGELEQCTCGRHEITFTPSITQGDVMNAYESLWGTPPPPWLVENPNRFRLATDSF